MHSTACGVGASTNSASSSMPQTDGFKMVHSNDDPMNKIPLKSASGLDDEEKNCGELINDTAAAEEARREQMRANILKWMKKLTIVLICFIGIALISYVIISLCFSDDSTNATQSNATSTGDNVALLASIGAGNRQHMDETTSSTNSALPVTLQTTTTTAPDIDTAANATTTANILTELDAGNTTAEEEAAQKETKTATLKNEAPTLADVAITDENFKSKLGVYTKGAVSSDKEVCSQIGSNTLQKNGSAVDAAISTLLCNGIVSMHSMGIGGGMLMNIYTKEDKRAYSVDGRDVAPYAAYEDMFQGNVEASLHGPLAIAVPGELMGLHHAHERFGKLPWAELVEPAVKICHEGYYLNQHMWNAIKYVGDHLKNNTILRDTFINATSGQVYPIGTLLKPHKELCATYELLAQNGPLDFYNGTLARLVAEDLKDLGSIITYDDLESYDADVVNSITMQLGNDTLYVMPPVSSGTIVANILSILEGYNLKPVNMKGAENVALTMHRMAEAMKYAFAKRWELSDLRFHDVRELVSKLTNPEHNIDLRMRINDSTVHDTIYDYDAQFAGVDDHGTSHVSVLAPNGDAVSVTSSVNGYFGSKLIGKRTGIIFNCGMNDFSIPGMTNQFGLPSTPTNFIDARKRPMSSMSPMVLANPKGDVRMVIGAAGGSKIISAVVEVMARVLWLGEDLKTAIDAPRFHHQLLPNILQYQDGGFSEEILSVLKSKGHTVEAYKDAGTVLNAITQNETAIYANSDYRKLGGVAGF